MAWIRKTSDIVLGVTSEAICEDGNSSSPYQGKVIDEEELLTPFRALSWKTILNDHFSPAYDINLWRELILNVEPVCRIPYAFAQPADFEIVFSAKELAASQTWAIDERAKFTALLCEKGYRIAVEKNDATTNLPFEVFCTNHSREPLVETALETTTSSIAMEYKKYHFKDAADAFAAIENAKTLPELTGMLGEILKNLYQKDGRSALDAYLQKADQFIFELPNLKPGAANAMLSYLDWPDRFPASFSKESSETMERLKQFRMAVAQTEIDRLYAEGWPVHPSLYLAAGRLDLYDQGLQDGIVERLNMGTQSRYFFAIDDVQAITDPAIKQRMVSFVQQWIATATDLSAGDRASALGAIEKLNL
ncbi:MAG: hypothetical protein HY540_01495 [Deltaproteobacteria bacterium]|nr:hypothetical protein [Deltaproteobacteria bacterium]